MLGIIIASLGWRWYVSNATACAFAQGVKAITESQTYIDGKFINIGRFVAPSIWSPSEGDYKACSLVGEEL